jgi:hypothetical protein
VRSDRGTRRPRCPTLGNLVRTAEMPCLPDSHINCLRLTYTGTVLWTERLRQLKRPRQQPTRAACVLVHAVSLHRSQVLFFHSSITSRPINQGATCPVCVTCLAEVVVSPGSSLALHCTVLQLTCSCCALKMHSPTPVGASNLGASVAYS